MATLKMGNLLNESKFNELKRTFKKSTKKSMKAMESHMLGSVQINSIIESGVLGVDESNALKEFFSHTNYKFINENTIRMIDKSINEGPMDWIASKYDQVKGYIQKGWAGVKAIWASFKDFVKGLLDQIKKFFKGLFEKIIAGAKGLMNKLTKPIQDKSAEIKKALEDPEQAKEIGKEITQANDCIGHIKGYVNEKLIGGALYANDVIQAKGNIKEATALLSDKEVNEVLLSLNEGGVIKHPEDILAKGGKTGKVAQKIVKYVVKILAWVFNPLGSALKVATGYLSKNALKFVSVISKVAGGPGAFAFAITGPILGEVAEIVHASANIAAHGFGGAHESQIKLAPIITEGGGDAIFGIDLPGLLEKFVPALANFIPTLRTVITVVEFICLAYALGTIIINVFVPLVKKIKDSMGSKKPSVDFKDAPPLST